MANRLPQYARFGAYIVEDRIGSGGMAMVFRARHEQTGEIVALKVLYEHFAEDPDIVKRFRREAEIAARLTHPHIVPVTDYGVVDHGRPFLAMRFMEGGSLASQFDKAGQSISLKATVRILNQLAGALDFAHQHGIIHRDLKLENILLDGEHKPYLSDFGIARVTDATRMTMTGMVTGTPYYMAPEQARGAKTLDHRADLYAFAVMAYLMATGYFPFTADEPFALMHQHVSAMPPLPTSVQPELPLALDPVLLQGLSKDPDERYQSAAQFAAAFAGAASDRKSDMRSVIHMNSINPVKPEIIIDMGAAGNATARSRRRTGKPDGQRGLILGALVAALVIVLAAGAFLLSRRAARTATAEVPTLAVLPPSATVTVVPLGVVPGTQLAVSLATMASDESVRPTLPPTWTPTPTATFSLAPLVVQPTPQNAAMLPPTQGVSVQPTNADSGLLGDAVVVDPAGAVLIRRPINGREIITIPMGTAVWIYGRSNDSAWVYVLTFDGIFGWSQRRNFNISKDMALVANLGVAHTIVELPDQAIVTRPPNVTPELYIPPTDMNQPPPQNRPGEPQGGQGGQPGS